MYVVFHVNYHFEKNMYDVLCALEVAWNEDFTIGVFFEICPAFRG